MRLRYWRQDLGWATFILVISAAMGLLYHWPLVRISFQGGLASHLEKAKTREFEIRFQGVKTVSLEQALARYQEGRTLFIDARPPEEFAELHIPGARNLTPEGIEAVGEQAVTGVAKDRPIVVYCGRATCDASLKVAEKLQSLGYTQVAAFLGGFRAWDEAGYPADTSN